jgi:hypothetical protein
MVDQKFLESPKISETNLRCDEKIFDQRQKSFCTRVATHRLSDKHFVSSIKISTHQKLHQSRSWDWHGNGYMKLWKFYWSRHEMSSRARRLLYSWIKTFRGNIRSEGLVLIDYRVFDPRPHFYLPRVSRPTGLDTAVRPVTVMGGLPGGHLDGDQVRNDHPLGHDLHPWPSYTLNPEKKPPKCPRTHHFMGVFFQDSGYMVSRWKFK